jgi:hypothetical protein
MENVETKTGLLGKLKQSDEGVKLAVAVGVGVTVGVGATLALQAYGRKRENDALRLQAPISTPALDVPRVTVLRMPAVGQ